jgi:signal transduction histidine kinase
VLNLLSNAVKYSEKDIDLNAVVENGHITLAVSDKGIGIPDHEQEKIFNKFFRAKNAATIQGTGLGLNIVQKYADLLGGTISFTSKQNVGTTFEVVLPVE